MWRDSFRNCLKAAGPFEPSATAADAAKSPAPHFFLWTLLSTSKISGLVAGEELITSL